MADLSLAFDPNKISAASDAASDAVSKATAFSDAASKANSDAISRVGTKEPAITAGTSAQYIKGDKSLGTLNQAAVAGLLITDGPTFDHLHLTSGQIGFPATQVPSADANTLDDYAEGTKEVAFSCGTSGTITIDPSFKTIHYNKIGRQVTVVGYLAVASVSSPVGWWGITGLPFTSAVHSVASIWSSGLQATAITTLMGFVRSGTTTIEIYKFSAGAAGGVAADVKAGAEIVFTVVYFI